MGSVRLDMDLRAGRSVALYRGVYVGAEQATGFLQRVVGALRTQRAPVAVTFTTSAVLHAFRWLPHAWRDPDAVVHLAVDATAMTRPRRGDCSASTDSHLQSGVMAFQAEFAMITPRNR